MVKKETYLTCPNPNIFEGITSISAILNKYEQNANSKRTIVRVLFDRNKASSKSRELSFLRKTGQKYGFSVLPVDASEIDALTTGKTHGGIIAECAPKAFPMRVNF